MSSRMLCPFGHFGQMAQLWLFPASCSPFFYPLLNKLTSSSNTSCVQGAWRWPGWFFGAAAVPAARDGGGTVPVVVLVDPGTILSLWVLNNVGQSSLARDQHRAVISVSREQSEQQHTFPNVSLGLQDLSVTPGWNSKTLEVITVRDTHLYYAPHPVIQNHPALGWDS